MPASGSSQASIAFTSAEFAGGSGKLSVKVKGGPKLATSGPGTDWRVETSTTGGFKVFRNDNRRQRDGKSIFGTPDSGSLEIMATAPAT